MDPSSSYRRNPRKHHGEERNSIQGILMSSRYRPAGSISLSGAHLRMVPLRGRELGYLPTTCSPMLAPGAFNSLTLLGCLHQRPANALEQRGSWAMGVWRTAGRQPQGQAGEM